MGVAPLLGWRKTSPELFRKGFRWPTLVLVITAVLHLALGRRLGFPAFITVDPIFTGTTGAILARMAGTYPFIAVMLVTFNFAVVVQEFARGVSARRKRAPEGLFTSLFNLVSKSRRRYGGYIVHVGIAVMLVGFVGRGWSLDKEATLAKGESVQFDRYTITYAGPRMEVDAEKRMIIADVDIARDGKSVGRISPAQHIYKSMGGSTDTRVARYITPRDELYMIVGMVNPQTKVASFQMHVNTLIELVPLGGILLILGALIAMWPEVTIEEAGAWGYVRAAGSVATAITFGLLLAAGSGQAYGAPPPLRPSTVMEATLLAPGPDLPAVPLP